MDALIGWTIVATTAALFLWHLISEADRKWKTREQARWDAHVATAISDTPMHGVLVDDITFAASVLPDIDELPGGAA